MSFREEGEEAHEGPLPAALAGKAFSGKSIVGEHLPILGGGAGRLPSYSHGTDPLAPPLCPSHRLLIASGHGSPTHTHTQTLSGGQQGIQAKEAITAAVDCFPQVCTGVDSSGQAPASPVAGGATFRPNRQENFYGVFTSPISLLQGECAVVVQVLRDTPGDAPLLVSCAAKELQTNVPDRGFRGRIVSVVQNSERRFGPCQSHPETM